MTPFILAEAISAGTPVSATLYGVGAAVVITCGFVARVTWRTAMWMRDIRDEVTKAKESWNVANQKDWAYKMERGNRPFRTDAAGQPYLYVPDPESVRRGASGVGLQSGDSTPPL